MSAFLDLRTGYPSEKVAWLADGMLKASENLPLIFPASEADDLSQLTGQELDKTRLVPSALLPSMQALCSSVPRK